MAETHFPTMENCLHNTFHPVTGELAATAARLKAAHRISLADAFAAALAKIRDAELVTGDRDFKAVENDLKKIRWLK
jgi:predicted nucleic acid-binding protein